MGWISEDGRHEGYMVPFFADGQRSIAVFSARIPEDQLPIDMIDLPDGDFEFHTRPAGEAVGWVICCDCNPQAGPSSTWVGPVFTRVPSAALADLSKRSIYAVDEDVAYIPDDEAVLGAAYEAWRSEHTFGIDALGEVKAAYEATLSAKARLDTAVIMARGSGASWAAVGRATSMSRQSAQERWGQQK